MKPSGNIKSTHDFEPFSVELPPAISTGSRIKYTGQERDNFTNYDYMHFRFYASSIGRFLTPDNIIPDVFNPQSWNLYSYVNGNPVNFNDPLGHTGQGMAKPYYFVNGGSASWLNCNTYCAFMSGLYGGNVTFGAGGVYGGGGTQSSGYWKPIYGTIVTTSGEPVWNEELQAWVGLEVKVIWEVAGYQYVEIKSGGEGRASAAIGALRELAKVFLRESFNFENKWPRYAFLGKSCYDYAHDLKERLTAQNLQYWEPTIFVRETYYFESADPSIPAHFSVVLEPINGNPFPPTWIDFYTFPNMQFGAYPYEWIIGPVRFSFHKD